MSQALEDIAAERRRQIEVEGWTAEHDHRHGAGQLAILAVALALPDAMPETKSRVADFLTPFGFEVKQKDRRRDLVRAGALIAAEIDRLDNADDVEARLFAWTGSGGIDR